MVAGFAWGWTRGEVVIDGPGTTLWMRLAADHFLHGQWSYWVSELWAGTPGWAISAPTANTLPILPLIQMVGVETAVKLASVAAQILGAWGAYVLARSLWDRQWPSVLAGLLYGLHPFVVSHSALAGHYAATVVVGATPWLVWSLRKALRGDGAQYVGLAALIAAFAVLSQPELAYGLLLLSLCILAVELARATKGTEGSKSRLAVLVRAGAVSALGLGLIAHWLVPLSRLSKSFILTPASDVKFTLVRGLGGAVGRQPSLLMTRSHDIDSVVTLATTGLNSATLYMTWVCLVLTLVTIVLLTRHDHDGTMTAILFASAIAVWMQTGGVPLVSSDLADRVQPVPFIAIGIIAGLLVGSFLRRLRPGSSGVVGGIITTLFLMALPYFAPFVALQRLIPMLSSVRYPRLYSIAPLGLALGAAFPLVLVERWARTRARPVRLAGWLSAALCVFVAGAFALDINPYRKYYFLQRPDVDAAYAKAVTALKGSGIASRVGSSLDPRAFNPLIDEGFQLTTGWPHPIASKDLWRLTSEPAYYGPGPYLNAAIALSSTSHVAYEVGVNTDEGEQIVPEVVLQPNPLVLPMVRAYEQAVIVEDSEIAPDLAVALAQRNIAVVSGRGAKAGNLPGIPHRVVGDDSCDDVIEATGLAAGDATGLAGDVAMSCRVRNWVGVGGRRPVEIGEGAGAIFSSPTNGLRGIGVWIDRGVGLAEMNLQEVDEAGAPVGDEIVGIRTSGLDFNGIALFRFDPIADSAGRRYRFTVTCNLCPEDDQPTIGVVAPQRAPGDLVLNGRLDTNRVTSFSLLYDGVPRADIAATKIDASRGGPGRWRLTTSGPRPSIVVVAESWFPGWRAEVDGREVPVLKADGAFLGVAVGPGDHTVTLEYRTPGVITGFALSLIAAAVAAVLIAGGVITHQRRRLRRRPPPPTG